MEKLEVEPDDDQRIFPCWRPASPYVITLALELMQMADMKAPSDITKLNLLSVVSLIKQARARLMKTGKFIAEDM